MPATKADALRTAQNIIQAASTYDRVDQQLAAQIMKLFSGSAQRARAVERCARRSEAAGAAGMAGGRRVLRRPGATPAAAASPLRGQGKGAGEMGQMMQMPCNWRSRRLRSDADGRYGGVDPQGIMQGVQSAMQQVGQMTGGAGEKTDPELEQQGDGPQDEVKHAEAANEKPPPDGAGGTECCGASAGSGSAADAVTGGSAAAAQAGADAPATSGPESVL